jgi:uncharacterized lipoprotein YmbA
MNAMKRWAMSAVCAAAMGLAGCASTPAPVLLTLPPAATGIAPRAATAAAPRVLVVRRLDIPEYLQVRRVRYRADDSTLAEWPDTYWAERIEIGMSREFNAALQQRLPDWRLCEANCAEQAPSLSLQVDITRLDYVRSERRLQARLRLALSNTERPPRLVRAEERSYAIEGDGDTPQSQARALSELMRRVADDAATAVSNPP